MTTRNNKNIVLIALAAVAACMAPLAHAYDIRSMGSTPLVLSTGSTSGTSVERMRVTSAGLVGIGTNSPSAALDVSGSLYATSLTISSTIAHMRLVPASNGGSYNYFQSGDAAGTIGSWTGLVFGDWFRGITTATPKLIIHGNGNVGINIVTPTERLEVVGNVSATHFIGDGSLLTGIASGAGQFISLTDVSVSTDAGNLFLGSISGATAGITGTTGIGASTFGAGTNTGSQNTTLGTRTLNDNTSGNNNIAIGSNVLASNTTGKFNIAIGNNALAKSTAPGNNLAIGVNTLASNIFNIGNGGGMYNVALGNNAQISNTNGQYNTAVGYNALLQNTNSSNNTAVGSNALTGPTSSGLSWNNTAVGADALKNLSAGYQNTAVGYRALYLNSSSANNSAFGDSALSSSTGSSNVALGYSSLSNAGNANTAAGGLSLRYTTGSSNAAFGYQAGLGISSTTAADNTFLGAYSGNAITSGNSNTLVGVNAGGGITTGSNNIVIGRQTTPYSNTGDNQLNIGNAIWGNTGSGISHSNLIGINVPSPTTALEVAGTVSATRFVGDGSLLTGVGGSSDRITSSTTSAVIANQAGGTVSFTLGGVDGAAYLHPTIGLVAAGVSTTGSISGTTGYFGGITRVSQGVFDMNSPTLQLGDAQYGLSASGGGMFFWTPSAGFLFKNFNNKSTVAALSSSGQLILGISNTTWAGSIRSTLHVSGSARVTSWTYLNGDTTPTVPLEVSGTVSATRFVGDGSLLTNLVTTTPDRITSGTTGIYTYNNTSASIATAGVERVVIGTTGEVGIAQQPTSGYNLAVSGSTIMRGRLNLQVSSGNTSVIIGNSGSTGASMVAVGYNTGLGSVGSFVTVVGGSAGSNNTASGLTAVGLNAGSSNAGINATLIGYNAGNQNNGNYAVAVGYGSAYNNNTSGTVAIGSYALFRNTNGVDNTGVGYYSGYNNTTGQGNSVFGQYAGYGVSSNNYSGVTALGAYAGYNTSTGSSNTLIGYSAGTAITTGGANSILGFNAGANVTTGSRNILMGYNTAAPAATGSYQLNIGDAISGNIGSGAGNRNLIGINITSPTAQLEVSGTISGTFFVGNGSGLTGVTGISSFASLTDVSYSLAGQNIYGPGSPNGPLNGTSRNTAMGVNSLNNSNTPASDNTAFGANALASNQSYNNTAVGSSALTSSSSGTDNTAVGFNTLKSTVFGQFNVAIGSRALSSQSGASGNVAVGASAGSALTTTGANTLLGSYAGQNITGSSNLLIGYGANPHSNAGSYQLGIANAIFGNIQNASTRQALIGINITSPTIELDVSGSIQYTGTITDISDRRLKMNIKAMPVPNAIQSLSQLTAMQYEMKNAPGQTEWGFIAQDVEKVFPTLVHTARDTSETKSLNYIGFVPVLVKSTQELAAENAKLKSENAALKVQQESILKRLDALEQRK